MLKYILTALFTIILVYVFFATINIRELFESFRDYNFLMFIPAILLYSFVMYLRSMRWAMLLKPIVDANKYFLFKVVIIGYMYNCLLPFRVGEIFRCYYIKRETGVSRYAIMSTVIIERLFDLFALLMIFLPSILFVPFSDYFGWFSKYFGMSFQVSLSIIVILSLVFLLFPIFAAFMPNKILDIVYFITKFIPNNRVRNYVVGMFKKVILGTQYLNSWVRILKISIFSIIIWVFEISLAYVVAMGFGIGTEFNEVIPVVFTFTWVIALLNIIGAIPITPGGVGQIELVIREVLILSPLIEVSRGTAGAYAILFRILSLLPIIILGQIYVWTWNYGKKSINKDKIKNITG